MAVVRLDRIIAAPPGRVFNWIADYRNASSFIEGLEPLRPAGGSSFEAVLHFGPRRIEATICLLEVKADRLVTWAMSGAESRTLEFRLTPAPGGCSVVLEVTYDRPTGITGVLMAPVVDEAVRSRAGGALKAIDRAMRGPSE